jgi:hypothetical protein
MDENKTVTCETKPTFSDLCRRAARVAREREMPAPTVSQAVAVARAAAATRARMGRMVASCYIVIGATGESQAHQSEFLHEVVLALEADRFQVSASPVLIRSGKNAIARMLLEW